MLDRTKPLTEVAGPVTAYETAVTSYENRYNEWALAKREQSVAFGVQNQAAVVLDQELRGVGLAILTERWCRPAFGAGRPGSLRGSEGTDRSRIR